MSYFWTDIGTPSQEPRYVYITKQARQLWLYYAEARAAFDAFLKFRNVLSPVGDWVSAQQDERLGPPRDLPVALSPGPVL